MNMKRTVLALAVGGAALGLIGAGVGAAFTDGGSATQRVSVGTFGINVTSPTQLAAVVNNGTVHTVTLTSPEIVTSGAGSIPFGFTVASTGDIPVKVHVEATTAPLAPFTSLLAAPSDTTIGALPASSYFDATMSWPELVNADLGKQVTAVYTITAMETSATFHPALGTYSRSGNLITIYAHTIAYNGGVYTFAPGDRLEFYLSSGSQQNWTADLAVADASGNIFYQGITTATVVGTVQVSVFGGAGHTSLYSLYPTRL